MAIEGVGGRILISTTVVTDGALGGRERGWVEKETKESLAT